MSFGQCIPMYTNLLFATIASGNLKPLQQIEGMYDIPKLIRHEQTSINNQMKWKIK